MSVLDDEALTDLICTHLGQVPGWEWEPDRDAPDYPADVVGIRYGATRPTPDRTIGVRVYAADDSTHLTVRRVQFRLRGARNDPASADALGGVLSAVLPGLSRWGGISDARRISFGPLGADDLGREERSENWQIILDNPEASE